MEKKNLGDWKEAIASGIRGYVRKIKLARVEKMTGADFGGRLYQEELGFDSSEGNDYTPSPDWLNAICKNRITKEDSILDLGCGKGYAMYLMSRHPFKKIYGIEISSKLCTIANDNFKKIDNCDRFEVWNLDATQLRARDDIYRKICDVKYIYIFNSFPLEVTKKVVGELEEMCRKDRWDGIIWYAQPSPECLDIMTKSDCFRLQKRHFKSGVTGGVYEFSVNLK